MDRICEESGQAEVVRAEEAFFRVKFLYVNACKEEQGVPVVWAVLGLGFVVVGGDLVIVRAYPALDRRKRVQDFERGIHVFPCPLDVIVYELRVSDVREKEYVRVGRGVGWYPVQESSEECQVSHRVCRVRVSGVQ